jgi:hypothetical protein
MEYIAVREKVRAAGRAPGDERMPKKGTQRLDSRQITAEFVRDEWPAAAP